MNKQDHTPTPWSYEITGANDYVLYGGSGQHYTIGEVSNFNEYEVNEANAAFIVRACNNYDAMLAALKECRAELYDSAHSSGDPSDPTNMQSNAVTYREAVAAIDLAEVKS